MWTVLFMCNTIYLNSFVYIMLVRETVKRISDLLDELILKLVIYEMDYGPTEQIRTTRSGPCCSVSKARMCRFRDQTLSHSIIPFQVRPKAPAAKPTKTSGPVAEDKVAHQRMRTQLLGTTIEWWTNAVMSLQCMYMQDEMCKDLRRLLYQCTQTNDTCEHGQKYTEVHALVPSALAPQNTEFANP